MEETDWVGILYRKGSKEADNSIYMWKMDTPLSEKNQLFYGVVFSKIYQKVSTKKADKISKEVLKYSGPEYELTNKIEKILRAED